MLGNNTNGKYNVIISHNFKKPLNFINCIGYIFSIKIVYIDYLTNNCVLNIIEPINYNSCVK